ncbi:MAG TPA: DUF5674 family protein [Candidatus Babeliales bacterium]|nr:DUF5674 family protein [Candidatus Babeliales bacterium]
MQLIADKISLEELKKMSEKMHKNIVKAVVDLEKGVMVVDADMHVDEEVLLLEEESRQEDLWGINIHPYNSRDEWIEFDSMINLRPSFGNRTRGVDDPVIQEKIKKLVNKLVAT